MVETPLHAMARSLRRLRFRRQAKASPPGPAAAPDSPPWVVVVGLVRDEAAAAEKFNTLVEWKNQGVITNVVITTWLGEYDRYPELMRVITSAGFLLVELEPPRLKMIGHIFHQKKALYYALRATPPGCLVLKLRPDLGSLSEGVRDCLQGEIDIRPPADSPYPRFFDNRIVLLSTFIQEPMYLGDIVFYGRREDLMMLADLPYALEFAYSQLAPEQVFFHSPFIDVFGTLDHYLTVQAGLVFENAELSARIRKTLLESDFYLEAAAVYHNLLYSYFRLGFIADKDRNDQAQKAAFGQITLEEFLAKAGAPGARLLAGPNAVVVENEAPLRALREGWFKPSPASERLAKARARADDVLLQLNSPANGIYPTQEARELAATLAGLLGSAPNKVDLLADAAGKRFLVRGVAERIDVIGGGDQRLHEEINMLRRTVDTLRAQLSAAS